MWQSWPLFFLRRGIGQISNYAADLFQNLCLHLLLLWTLQKQEVVFFCTPEVTSYGLFQFLGKFFFQFGLQLISLKPTGHNFLRALPTVPLSFSSILSFNFVFTASVKSSPARPSTASPIFAFNFGATAFFIAASFAPPM